MWRERGLECANSLARHRYLLILFRPPPDQNVADQREEDTQSAGEDSSVGDYFHRSILSTRGTNCNASVG